LKSGNIESKTTLNMHYLSFSTPFNSAYQNLVKVRPHQTISLDEPNKEYKQPKLNCKFSEVDCYCSDKSSSEIFEGLIDPTGLTPTLIWLDPCKLKNECLAYFIFNWKQQIDATQNVALGIIVPKVNNPKDSKSPYKLWRIGSTGPLYDINLDEPTWYPSLARDNDSLEKAAKELDPYDIFPLVEFPNVVIQPGERALTDHYSLLENYRTRTRNIINLDVSSPCHAFRQLYTTIRALPKFGPSIIQPVVTPGGTPNGYLTVLLAGVLAESCFFTPKDEIPMSSNNEIQGIIIVEKCI